jgi:hypothetical protein
MIAGDLLPGELPLALDGNVFGIVSAAVVFVLVSFLKTSPHNRCGNHH